jgi:hypothetical protein
MENEVVESVSIAQQHLSGNRSKIDNNVETAVKQQLEEQNTDTLIDRRQETSSQSMIRMSVEWWLDVNGSKGEVHGPWPESCG